MTSRRLLVEKEYMKVNISVGKAVEGRDALAKEVLHTHVSTLPVPLFLSYTYSYPYP